MIIKRPFELFL